MQDFVAPEVRQIKADVGALGAKVDALDSKFESKIDALNAKFDARFDSVHSEFRARFDALHSEFSALHSEFDSLRSEVRFNQQGLMGALQNATLRGDMATQREISELRERVTRIEDQLRTPRQ